MRPLVLVLVLCACGSATPGPVPVGGAGGSSEAGGSGGGGSGGGSTEFPVDSGAPDVVAAAEVAAPVDAAPDVPAEPAPPGCVLAWSPSAMREGGAAFEFLELPDRNMIHAGAMHLSAVPERDAYRFDSHYQPPTVDFDRALFTGPVRDDRLRGEVRGMVGASGPLELVNGQTWRLSWSLFIPGSLKGTARFTHIMQLKFVDTGGGLSGSPIITLSLAQPDTIALRLWLGGGSFPTVNLAPLHDRWLSTTVVVKVGNPGSVQWIFKDGDKVLVDQKVSGTTWPGNARRVWPKWGIYRGITGGVQTTYMMTADYRAYQCEGE